MKPTDPTVRATLAPTCTEDQRRRARSITLQRRFKPSLDAMTMALTGLLKAKGPPEGKIKKEGTPAPLAGTTDVPNRKRDRNGHTRD